MQTPGFLTEAKEWMGMIAAGIMTLLMVLARVTGWIPTRKDFDDRLAAAKEHREAIEKRMDTERNETAADIARMEGRLDGVSAGIAQMREQMREDRALLAGKLDTLAATIDGKIREHGERLTTTERELTRLRDRVPHGAQDAAALGTAAAALTRQAERLGDVIERLERKV